MELEYLDPLEGDYDSIPINLVKIRSPNLLTVIKVKEIVLFGHARDIEEITSDFGAQVSRIHHFNQMLGYYPLLETSRSIVTD